MSKQYDIYIDGGGGPEPNPPKHSIPCQRAGTYCHDPKCNKDFCLRKEIQILEKKEKSEELWEKMMEKVKKTPWKFEDRPKHDKDQTIAHLSAAIDRLTEEHHHRKHQRVEQVLFFIFNNNKYITMALSIASNQSAPIVLGLIDADTRLPITATFAGETETSDNPDVATTDPVLGLVANKANTTGGSGNLTSVATWTYTDKNTNQLVTIQKTTVTPFTVTPVITAENVEMTVTLGIPVTQA